MKLERWGWYSVLVNVLLAGLHGLIAWVSGSLAVFAELVHNLIDLLGAVAVLLGIRLASRKSHAFPYGLYKVESLVAVGLAALVLLTAYEIPTAVDDGVLPGRTAFVSQHPNPFNPATQIVFDLERTGPVEVGIFDVRGQRVATLERGTLQRGRHSLTWQGLDDAGRAMASGVYFCRLFAAGETATMKMMLAR